MTKQQQDPQLPLIDVLNAIEADEGVMAYVGSLGVEGRKQLLDIATQKSKGKYAPGERARAVFLLGEMRWRPAFKSLRTLLHDESRSVRLNAIYALSDVGGPHAVQPLMETVRDPKGGISEKAHALHCLADIGDRNTLNELESWAEDVQTIELRRLAKDTNKRLRSTLKGLEVD